MKYTITINQYGIFESGLHTLTDLVDWAIIDYMKDWFFAERKRVYKTEDSREFIWLNYNYMLEQMPLLAERDEITGRIRKADKNKLSKRIKKLKELGLIDTFVLKDNTLFFTLTSFCVETCFKRGVENKETYHQNDDRPTIKMMTAYHQNDDSPISNTNISNINNKNNLVESLESSSNESFSKQNGKTEIKRNKPKLDTSSLNFIDMLKQSPAYAGIDIDRELAKMDVWLTSKQGKGRKKTERFIINWLNRVEVPISTQTDTPKEDNSMVDKIKKGVAEYERYLSAAAKS